MLGIGDPIPCVPAAGRLEFADRGGSPVPVVVWASPSRANAGDKATHDFLSLYTAAKDAALPLLHESKLPPPPTTTTSHQGACRRLPACDSPSLSPSAHALCLLRLALLGTIQALARRISCSQDFCPIQFRLISYVCCTKLTFGNYSAFFVLILLALAAWTRPFVKKEKG